MIPASRADRGDYGVATDGKDKGRQMSDNKIETLVVSLMQAIGTLLDTAITESSAQTDRRNQGFATADMERRLQRAVAQIDEINLGLTVDGVKAHVSATEPPRAAIPASLPAPSLPAPSLPATALATGPTAWAAPSAAASSPTPVAEHQTSSNQLGNMDLSAFAQLLNNGLFDLFAGQPA